MIKVPENVQSLINASTQINSHSKAVEELVCNSLDAGATSIAIRVNIQENTIQVIDNGCGVCNVDVKYIGQKYMTSGCIDLSTLKSAPNKYGFRGQSLANIINVSKTVKVISRHEKSEETWMKLFEHGKEKQIKICNTRPSKGTTVEVHGFLYNTSMQNKSKDILTELQSIKTLLEQFSLVHSNISLSLRDDSKNEILFKMHKNRDIYQTLSTLYNIEKEEYQELKVEKHEYKLTAFLGNSDEETGRHFIFLNGKCISNTSKLHRIVNNNLSKHFKLGSIRNPKAKFQNINKDEENYLFQKRIPFYFIFIKCPYADYDLSNLSKQSVLEFKDWNQVIKLVDKLIKFFNGNIRLKENNGLNKTKANQKRENSDTREQVKKIMEKILGDHSKKPGICQMHNGVKGKQVKRKTKQTVAKYTPNVIIYKENNDGDFAVPNTRHPRSKDIFEKCTVDKATRKKRHSNRKENHGSEKQGLKKSSKRKEDNGSYKLATKKYSKPNYTKSCLGSSMGKAYNSKFKKVSNNKKIMANIMQPHNTQLINKDNKTNRVCVQKDKLIRKFEMETESVKKRCDDLEKITKDLLNRKDKRQREVLFSKNMQFDNIIKNNINVSIRKQIDEIIIHDFNPKLQQNTLLNNNKVCNNVKQKVFQSNYDLVQTILSSQQNSTEENHIPGKPINSVAMMSQIKPCIKPRTYEPEINMEFDKNPTETVATFQSHRYYVNTENNEYCTTDHTDLQIQNIDIRNYKRPRTFITKQSRDNFNSQKHNIFKKKTGFSLQFRSNLKRLYDQTAKLFNLKNKILGHTGESSYSIEFTESNNYKVADNQNYRHLNETTRNASRNIDETLVNYNYNVHNDDIRSSCEIADKKPVKRIIDLARNHYRNVEGTWTQEVNYNDYNVHKNAININPNTYTVSNIDNNGYTVNDDNCNLYGTYTIEHNNERIYGSKASPLDINFDDNCANNRNFIFISNSQERDQNEQIMLDPIIDVCDTILNSQDIIYNKEFELSFDNKQSHLSQNCIDHADSQKRYENSLYGSYKYLNSQNKELTEDDNPKQNGKRYDEYMFTEVSHHFSQFNNNVEIHKDKTVNESIHQSPILTTKFQNKLLQNETIGKQQIQGNVDRKIVKDSSLGNFNLKNRLCFLPKGMSPIFENCHTKNDCEYNLSENYYEDEMYNNFVDNVHNNAEIFELRVEGANDLTTKAIDKVNYKLNKDNSSLKFDGQLLKGAEVLGQIDEKFIAAIVKGGFNVEAMSNYLILFDQHAVHERIRLERNISEYLNENQWKPVHVDEVTLKMSNDDILYLHNFKDKFEQLGLKWTALNANEVSIGAIPEAILGKNPRQVDRVIQAVKKMITEEIGIIKMQGGCISLYPKSIMDLVFSESCRYAIKFGEKLSKSECVELLEMLSDCKTPFQCAHGRPVMAVIMDIKQHAVDYKVNFNNVMKWRKLHK